MVIPPALPHTSSMSAEPQRGTDPLAALPEAELRAQVLSQLSSEDKRAAALVCRAWRAAVDALPVQRLRLTTDQVSQDAFIAWLRRPGRAEQVWLQVMLHIGLALQRGFARAQQLPRQTCKMRGRRST